MPFLISLPQQSQKIELRLCGRSFGEFSGE